VDVKIAGSPPTPLDLLRGLLAVVEARCAGDRLGQTPISNTGSEN